MPEPDDFPIDPEFTAEHFVDGLLGIRATARMLGELKKSLVAEGFDEKEAFGLCEAYLVNTIADIEDEDGE